jgi:hypothetical protein
MSIRRQLLVLGSALLLTAGCSSGNDEVVAGGVNSGPSNAATPSTPDAGGPTASPVSSATAVTDGDRAVVQALRAYAADPSAANFERVPWADTLSLGVGTELMRTVPAAELQAPEAWAVRPDSGYEWASSGPFNALDLLDQDEPYQTTVGAHPHCASEPKPAPADVADMRRVSTQPTDGACPAWYTVDLFMEQGEIHAVTLDLWEP